jgi:TonB family protein
MFPLLLSSAADAQKAAPAWTAVGKWNVHYFQDQCRAGRDYSNGKAKAAVGFEARPLDDSIAVMVVVPRRTSSFHLERSTGVARFGALEHPVQSLVSAPHPNGGTLYTFSAPRQLVDALAERGIFTFSAGRVSIDLPVANAESVLKAMDECVADLLEGWGLNREAQARLATGPTLVKGMPVVDPADYPAAAVRFGKVGEVQAVVQVGVDGTVQGCRIAVSSGHAELDAATCLSITKRARFMPARDRAAQPMTAPYLLPVRWFLED